MKFDNDNGSGVGYAIATASLLWTASCYVEVAASYHPNAAYTHQLSSDSSVGGAERATSIEIWTGVFWDVGGVALHGSPSGYGSVDHSSSEDGLANTGPHVRLDVDLPIELSHGLNVRATAAYAAFNHLTLSGEQIATVSSSGNDAFLGASLSTLLHDISFAGGVHKMSYQAKGPADSRVILDGGWGVQARLMVRIGLATYYLARHGALPKHAGPCHYAYLGYRCPSAE